MTIQERPSASDNPAANGEENAGTVATGATRYFPGNNGHIGQNRTVRFKPWASRVNDANLTPNKILTNQNIRLFIKVLDSAPSRVAVLLTDSETAGFAERVSTVLGCPTVPIIVSALNFG